MKQSVKYWNLHNHKPFDEYIADLIQLGHSIKSTMATAYHENQVIRAVIISEQVEEPKSDRFRITDEPVPEDQPLITLAGPGTKPEYCLLVSMHPRIARNIGSTKIYLLDKNNYPVKTIKL